MSIFAAYHEAGHFVAHHYLGPDDFGILSIVPNEGMGSGGHFAPLEDLLSEKMQDGTSVGIVEVENKVVELYAGAAAELRFDPSRQEQVRFGAEFDNEKAASLIDRFLTDAQAERADAGAS